MKAGRKQLLLVAGAVALTAILYFAPTKVDKPDTKEEKNISENSFDDVLANAKQRLKREELEPIGKLEEAIKIDAGNYLLLDSLGSRWDLLGMPFVSAHYYEAHAQKEGGEKNWLNAAYRYFDAFRMTDDSATKVILVQKAITGYENVLKINPNNLDAKTDLGVCYAEATAEPMKGIMMLREVVTENPEHENAQFNLGVLSMRSGQYDKAVERFEKVLKINPARKEMYLMIGRGYMMAGKKDKALENFESLKKETTNAELVTQANNFISQINNH